MKERIVKIVDYGTFIGFPIRVSCLILVAGVATAYGFVLYFLPSPYCWILIGVEGVTCIIGIVGAVSCFQLFTKLYIVLQGVLVIPIAVIFGYVIHVVIYYSKYSCNVKCKQSYYKGWLHDQGLLLLWVVMIVAIVGTGLLGLTLLGFKKLISHQSHTHGTKDHHNDCGHGHGNQTCQPIQQNPQTTVVINQSMPMMGGQMGGQMPGFMGMPMMMQQPNPMQSNMFTIPMGMQPMQQTTTNGTQDGQPMMMNPQFPMNQFYPWFNPMAMMQAQQAAAAQMTVPAQVHATPAETPAAQPAAAAGAPNAPVTSCAGMTIPNMCSYPLPKPMVQAAAVQKAANVVDPVEIRTLAPSPEIETASMVETASLLTFTAPLGLETNKPIKTPVSHSSSISESVTSSNLPAVVLELLTAPEVFQERPVDVEYIPAIVNHPEIKTESALIQSLESLIEPPVLESTSVCVSKPVPLPDPVNILTFDVAPIPDNTSLVKSLEPTAPLELSTRLMSVKTRPTRTCSL